MEQVGTALNADQVDGGEQWISAIMLPKVLKVRSYWYKIGTLNESSEAQRSASYTLPAAYVHPCARCDSDIFTHIRALYHPCPDTALEFTNPGCQRCRSLRRGIDDDPIRHGFAGWCRQDGSCTRRLRTPQASSYERTGDSSPLSTQRGFRMSIFPTLDGYNEIDQHKCGNLPRASPVLTHLSCTVLYLRTLIRNGCHIVKQFPSLLKKIGVNESTISEFIVLAITAARYTSRLTLSTCYLC